MRKCDGGTIVGKRRCPAPATHYVTGGHWTSASCEKHLGAVVSRRVEILSPETQEIFGPVRVTAVK